MHRVVIIGGGASGLFATIGALREGNQVILIEKNEKLGKKIYITGKGRCNLTNDVDKDEFFSNVISNPKFMFSPYNALSPQMVIDFFVQNGMPIKVERGNRVFPISDKASDVTKTLEKFITKNGAIIRLNETVKRIITIDGQVKGVITDKDEIDCDSVIVCTGGISYPLTGSTGDGYKFAKELGHNLIAPKPSLVGIELKGNEFLSMQGLSLKNINFKAIYNEKTIYEDFGELLFTHFGISGPVVLSCSAKINRLDVDKIKFIIDLKPALDEKTLDARLLREFSVNNNKSIVNVIRSLLPKTLIDIVLKRASISPQKNCSEITLKERNSLISVLKTLVFEGKRLRGIEEAIVTAGGVDVKSINPKTMESKLIKGLYFAGEVIDVDGFTGGFNLQIAFSTGYLAGINA